VCLIPSKLDVHEASRKAHLKKKFQKIKREIEIIGTYPNSPQTCEGTLGPFGVKTLPLKDGPITADFKSHCPSLNLLPFCI